MKTKTKTRVLSLLLTLAMLLTSFVVVIPASAAAWDGKAKDEPTLKDGVYQIGTAAELAYFFDKIATGDATYSAANAKLTANIDLLSKDWTFVGGTYTGTFDGNGKTISNLKLNKTISAVGSLGLFATTAGDTTIKNLKLVLAGASLKVSVAGDWSCFGALVGKNTGNLTVTNVNISGTATATFTGHTNWGSFMGANTGSATFTDCSNDLDVTINVGSTTSRIGGFVGAINSTSSKLAFVRCTNSHKFTLKNTNSSPDASGAANKLYNPSINIRIGGFIGVTQVAPAHMTFVNCVSTGETYGEFGRSGNHNTGLFVGCENGAANYTVLTGGEYANNTKKAYSARTPALFNEGILAVSQTNVENVVTVKIAKDTVDSLNALFAGWTVKYNGVAMTKGDNDGDGNEVYTAEYVKGAVASITLPTANAIAALTYNIKSNETFPIWVTSDTPFESGEGTEAEPYVIKTADQLRYFGKTVVEGNAYEGKFITLANDINMANTPWTTTGGGVFKGTFDGAGYSINNLKLAYSSMNTVVYLGFFTEVQNATIKNVTFNLAESTLSTKGGVGLIAGQLTSGTLNATNVHVNGHATVHLAYDGGNSNVGGIVGQIASGADAIFTDCSVDLKMDVALSKATSRTGGFVGNLSGVGTVLAFINCSNKFYVTFTGDTNTRFGGLLGVENAKAEAFFLIDTNSAFAYDGDFSASLSAKHDYVGIGENNTGKNFYVLEKTKTAYTSFLGSNDNFTYKRDLIVVDVDKSASKVVVTVGKSTDSYLKTNFTAYTVTYGTSVATVTTLANNDVQYEFVIKKGEENLLPTINFSYTSTTDNTITHNFVYTLESDQMADWSAYPSASLTEVDGVYTINNANDLAKIAAMANAGETFEGKTVKLADGVVIDLAGKTWDPIGYSSATGFMGTFDGNSSTGARIINVQFGDQGYHGTAAGFFGYLKGTIQNLNIHFNTQNAYVHGVEGLNPITHCTSLTNFGALVGGTTSTAATIKNTNISGVFKIETVRNLHVAPFVASVGSATTITDCQTSLDITYTQTGTTSTILRYGGAVAIQNGALTIENFSNTGDLILAEKPAAPRAGGIIGDCQSGATTLTNCFATGELAYLAGATRPSVTIGRIIGRTQNSTAPTMTNCYAGYGMAKVDVGGVDTGKPAVTGTATTFGFGINVDTGVVTLNATALAALEAAGYTVTVTYGTQSKTAPTTNAGNVATYIFEKEAVASAALVLTKAEKSFKVVTTEKAEIIDFAVATITGGTGADAANAYLISNVGELGAMAYLVNYGGGNAKHYKLDGDIDVSNFEWTTIQQNHNATYFTGSFDGDNNKLIGVNLTDDYYLYTQSMFGNVRPSGNAITNLTIEDATLKSGVVAGPTIWGYSILVGSLYNGTIDNVHVTGLDITVPEMCSDAYIGSLVGYLANEEATLQNSSAEGTIVVNSSADREIKVGGLVSRSRWGKVLNCASEVDITVNTVSTNNSTNVGGIIGLINADKITETTVVTNVANSGSITVNHTAATSGATSAAGIIGRITKGDLDITNAFNGGEIVINSEAESGIFVAAIIGHNGAAANADTSVSGGADITGTTAMNGTTVEDEAAYKGDLGLTTIDGARVRIAPDALENSGIRFDSYISADVVAALQEKGYTVTFGTMIAKKDTLDSVNGNWDALVDMGDEPGSTKKVVVYDVALVNGGNYNFHGALRNIQEKHYNVEFTAVAYMTITIADGVTVTIYGDATTTRSIKTVAERALEDPKANYTDEQRAILDVYAGK